ncbi:MAG: hypothetical protein HUU56_17435 [Bdellovibrionaceae bacterium]|nr:hypothetical protein [Pseudobdellovibrionaceae bacterium]
MKYLFILAVLFTLPGVGFAQGAALENELDSELDQLYTPPASKKNSAAAKALTTQNVQAPQPIYILNQATPSNVNQVASQQTSQQNSVQKQPTTFVEASPLVESKAEQMRKSRVDAESQTETKIVEKLEQSRLDDEKKRADVLFGSKFDQLSNQPKYKEEVVTPEVNHQPVSQTVPVQVVQPTPVQVVFPEAKKEGLTRDDIREEISSALKAEQEVQETSVEQRYFTGLIGFPEYPDSTNIKGNYSLGATFGTKYDDTYAVEGSFIFSNYTMNPVYITGYLAPNMDVNQYAASIGMKYFMLSGMVKPFVGGLVQYNYRTYSWSQGATQYYGNNYYNNTYNNNSQNANSHAIDLGLNVGADISFSSKFTVGVDYRYFFNLSSRKDNTALVYQPFYGTPLEQMNSSLLSISAKVNF